MGAFSVWEKEISVASMLRKLAWDPLATVTRGSDMACCSFFCTSVVSEMKLPDEYSTPQKKKKYEDVSVNSKITEQFTYPDEREDGDSRSPLPSGAFWSDEVAAMIAPVFVWDQIALRNSFFPHYPFLSFGISGYYYFLLDPVSSRAPSGHSQSGHCSKDCKK